MTSTILTAKSNFNSVFRQSVKRLLPNIILSLVLSFMTGIIGVSLTLNYYSDLLVSYIANKNTGEIELTNETLALIGTAGLLCGFFSLFSCVRMFKEIYSKRACDFYFSLPVKRETYFCANFILGALLNVVLYVIPVVIYVTSLKINNSAIFKFDEEYVLKAAISVVLCLVAMFSAFMLCAVVAGKKIHYVLLSLICIFSPSVVTSGIILRLNQIWGLKVDSTVADAISPPLNAISSVFSSQTDLYKYFIAISVVEIVGMFAAGLIVFKARKAEAAEVNLSGRITPYFLLSVFVLSGFMYANSVSNEIITVITGIFFAAVSGLLFSAVFYKKAFTKKTAITTGVTCLAGILFIGIVYLPIYDSYVKYVPEESEIEKVEFYDTYGGDSYEIALISQLLEFSDESIFDSSPFVITDEKGISDTLTLHEKLVSDDIIKVNKTKNITSFEYLFFDQTATEEKYNVGLIYTLKDGTQVKRYYTVGMKSINEQLLDLFSNKEFLEQNYDYSKNGEFLFGTVQFYTYFDTYEDTAETVPYDENNDYHFIADRVINEEQCKEFMEIYVDVLANAEHEDLAFALNMSRGVKLNYINVYADTALTGTASINFFCLNDEAPDDVKERIKSLSSQEIADIYYGYYSTDNNDVFRYVDVYSVETYDTQTDDYLYVKNLK